MTVEIVEVMDRSAQGITRPFVCRADNGEVYFVKGRDAGRRSQICEWVAGKLAREIGLPIAPFELVEVPEELVAGSGRPDIMDLGSGPSFGSQRFGGAELTLTHLGRVPEEIQRDVLAFDWWIRNADRGLGEFGGNPNLLWDPVLGRLVVIDHNLAFDPSFSARDFVERHAFRDQWNALTRDWMRRDHYRSRFGAALANWGPICQTIPAEWWFVDPEQTVPTDFSADTALSILSRCNEDTFWNVP